MNFCIKIVVTDTNIITDLDNAEILDIFIKLDNVYMCDVVKNDELNDKTISNSRLLDIKCLSLDEKMLEEVLDFKKSIRKLSFYDIANYVIAKYNNGILATGDEKLRRFATENGVEVIRTLKIIELLYTNKLITKEKFIKALELLEENDKTRIPKEEIEKLKVKFFSKIAA